MKLLAVVHRSLPTHGAGAEAMLHSIFRWHVSRGHEAKILARNGVQPCVYEGVTIDRIRSPRIPRDVEWADIVFTHLDLTRMAVGFAERHFRPVVHLVHNDSQLRFFEVDPAKTALAIFNSQWIESSYHWWRGPWIVTPPPVFAEDYVTTPGDAITLINLNGPKGGELFWDLARAMPDQKFIGVVGAYGEQVIPRIIPPNVELMQNRPDVREIYNKTRVLLMPSTYESYGRVCIEAAASGIPTVCSVTPGLKESISFAGVFCDTRHPREWEYHIRRVLNDWPSFSRRAKKRSEQLDPVPSLIALEKRLLNLLERSG